MPTGNRALFRNAYALMAATVSTSLLGMAYWAVAARLSDAASVGRASAAVSAMLLLSTAGQLNLSVGLMRFLPVMHGRERRTIAVSYGLAASCGLLLGVCFLAVAPHLSPELKFLQASPEIALTFVAGVSVWTIFALQDAILTGLRAAAWIPVENTVFGIFKLALLLPLVSALAGDGILVSWVAPMIVMLLPVNLLIFRHILPRTPRSPAAATSPPTARSMIGFVGGDYIGMLLSHASTTALPLLVISLAGAHQSAVFYIAWTLGTSLDFIAKGTASSFLVEGSGDPTSAASLRTSARRRALLLLFPAALGTAVLAGTILALYGTDYRQGRWAVVLLCVASVPRLLVLLEVAYLRVHRRIRTVVGLQALGCGLMLGASALVLGSGGGATGVAACWLVSQCVVLTTALVSERPTTPGQRRGASTSAPPRTLTSGSTP